MAYFPQGATELELIGRKTPSDYSLGALPSGVTRTVDYLKETFMGGGLAPSQKAPPTHTGSSLLLPAVAVVGAVGLLLILKKKK